MNKFLLFAIVALVTFNSQAHGDDATASSAAAHDHHGADARIGVPGQTSEVTRTVAVDMRDTMRFSPSDIPVRQGETIRFRIGNSGKLQHEFVLGTPAELQAHHEMMMRSPGMKHADASAVTVPPGQAAELIWHFTKAGRVDFACLEPGHFELGMKGAVEVAQARPDPARAARSSNPSH